MKKRRIALNLDDDVVSALEAMGGRSLSDPQTWARARSRRATAHRRALLDWLDRLDAEMGAPTREDLAAADRLLDEVFGPSASLA